MVGPPEMPAIQPLRIYLDQADWSYLSDGKYPSAEARLRELGQEGEVLYWISHEHLFETGALTVGLQARLEFLRGFPAIFMMECCSAQVLHHDFEVLLATATGAKSPEPLQVRGVSLSGSSVTKLNDMVRDSRSYVNAMMRCVSGERHSRRARPETQKEQASEAKFSRVFMKGDWRAVQKHLKKRLPRWTWFDAANAKMLMSVASSGERLLERIGMPLLADGKWDITFTRVVLPRVVMEAMSQRRMLSPATVAEIAKLWRDAELRPMLVPSMACVAAVIENVYRRPKEEYGLDAELDWKHAAYAPWVNVFTCDKRNHDHIDAVIRKREVPSRILRTNQLDRVVDAIEELLLAGPG